MYHPLPAGRFEQLLEGVASTTRRIVDVRPVSKDEWRNKIEDMYSLCNSSLDTSPFQRLFASLERTLAAHVKVRMEVLAYKTGVEFLQAYVRCWDDYQRCTEFIHRLYNHFNANIARLSGIRSCEVTAMQGCIHTTTLSIQIWKDMLSHYDLIPRMIKCIIEEVRHIQQQPHGHGLDTMLIYAKDILYSIVKIDCSRRPQNAQSRPLDVHTEARKSMVYINQFEVNYLILMEHTYNEKCMLLTQNNMAVYIREALDFMNREVAMAEVWLPSLTIDKIKQEMMAVFVEAQAQPILISVNAILRSGNDDDLKKLYDLTHFTDMGPWVDFDTQFYEYIKTTVLEKTAPLMKFPTAQEYIDVLLREYTHFRNILVNLFRNNNRLHAALGNAFRSVVNHRPSNSDGATAPDMLARYVDSILRKNGKSSSSDIEDTLDKCLDVFRFMDDKDIFQKFYSHHLAKRLIFNCSTNQDLEEALIMKIKVHYGHEYTNKLQRMISDRNVSLTLSTEFSTQCSKLSTKMEVIPTVYVLQTGSWPLGSAAPEPLDLPRGLVRASQEFQKFYSNKYNGRLLHWNHQLSSGEVRTTYLPRQYFISMSVYQMSVLLLFNAADRLTISDIGARTKISSKPLRLQLNGLIDCKLLMLSNPATKYNWQAASDDLVIMLNKSFAGKRIRFKVATTSSKEVKEETDRTRAAAIEDRSIWLQAAIVRIMKARQTLDHSQLTTETIQQCAGRFKPNISLIKKAIETLLEKQFLERSPEKRDTYIYLA